MNYADNMSRNRLIERGKKNQYNKINYIFMDSVGHHEDEVFLKRKKKKLKFLSTFHKRTTKIEKKPYFNERN